MGKDLILEKRTRTLNDAVLYLKLPVRFSLDKFRVKRERESRASRLLIIRCEVIALEIGVC